jgi:hypothetical protein
LRRQSPCSSASGRTDSGLAVRRSSAPFKKNARFAGRFSLVRTEVILQAGEGRVFGLLRPLPRLLLQRHDPADSARRRDTSGRGPWGPVRFQSGNREVTSPAPRPGEP